MHRGFIGSLEMSFTDRPFGESLLAQLVHLAVTITAWMHELCRAPEDTQALEKCFPALCVPPRQ